MWFARRGEHATTREEIHSDKPDCSLEWFERHWPNTPKIELNARREREGWSFWGDELPFKPPLSPHDPETGEIISSDAAEVAGTMMPPSESAIRFNLNGVYAND